MSGCMVLNFQLGLDHDSIKSVDEEKVYDYFSLLFNHAFSVVSCKHFIQISVLKAVLKILSRR